MSDEVLKQLAGLMARQTEILEKMGDGGLHTKAPATSMTAQTLYGPGGLFSTFGLDRAVITAHITPMGLGPLLQAFPALETDPRFPNITGYSGDIGDEPSVPCADAPTGYLKGCNLTAQFGRIQRDTDTIEIDAAIRRLRRGVSTDLLIMGDLLSADGGGLQRPANLSTDQILNSVAQSEMVGAGVALERKVATMLWQGTPANNVGTGYMEFPGLDVQIATGQVDADTNTACAAMDSDVKNFNWNRIDGTALDIVEYMLMLEEYLRHNAERMRLAPVEWIICMRPELWLELTAVWPCRYMTNRCTTAAGANVAVATDYESIQLRNTMRRDNTIEINGRTFRVLTDDGIYEYNNANNANCNPGEYASSIYFVPVTIRGNFPVTFWQFMDYRSTAFNAEVAQTRYPRFWTDDGRFLWSYEEISYCFKFHCKVEPRVILRTPQLAGRIDRIKYVPLQHLRAFDPDSPYWADGGVSLRAIPTTYAVWKPR